MSISHPEGAPTEDRLRRFLAESFPPPKSTVSSATDAPYPLLLLRLQHELAGFALSNGNPRECYDQSYSFFKRLYADRHQEWDDLNLTFVFCLGHRDRELETFCARIETDVYFCRKFTVTLDAPLDKELARLPFFPLERPSGRFQRPPSAQVLLKNIGVPATLATSIVERVGEETITDKCLSGQFGEPSLKRLDTQQPQIEVSDPPQSIRLTRVEIKNFRAYRQPQSFDLDADLVLLYGANGFGKTSFFDAIDFAATGDIGRLRLNRQDSRFAKAAIHLDCASEPSYVRLAIRAEDGDHSIWRSVQQRRGPFLDESATDRKNALITLTGRRASPGAERIEHLVRLFRATHLFSQEFQTLTDDFRENCRLSADDVSRMLAFEDYVSAGRKIGKVLELIRNLVANGESRKQEITDKLARDRQELERCRQSAEAAESPQAITALWGNMRQKLDSEGIEISAETDPVAEARGWRAVLETRITDARALATRLSELAAQAPLIDERREALTKQQDLRSETAKKLEETDTQHHATGRSIANIESELATLVEREYSLRDRAKVLAWLRETKPAYDTLTARQTTLTGEIGALTKTLADQNEALERLATDVGAAEAQLTRTTQELQEDRTLVARLADLSVRYQVWQQHISRRGELDRSAAENGSRLATLQTELQEATDGLNNATTDEQQAAADVAQIELTQNELHKLLSALEAHVTTAVCPACGIRHESTEELLRRLREQRNASAASTEARSRFQQLRERVAALHKRVEELSTQHKNVKQNASAAAAELETLTADIKEFETIARELGFEPADPGLALRMRERQAVAEQRGRDLAETFEVRRQAAETARNGLAAARAQLEARSRELAAKKESLHRATIERDRFQSDAAQHHITLEDDIPQITENEITNQRETGEVSEMIAAKRADLSDGQKSLAEQNRQTEAIRQQLADNDAAIRTLQEAIETHEQELDAIELGRQASRPQIAERVEQEAHRVSTFEGLKQSVIGLEVAFDAAAMSAMSAELAARIHTAEREMATINQKQIQERKWAAFFQQVKTNLEETQHTAVAAYTDEYGPLTSIIQRRLRSVSGFADIVLHPEGGNIDVRVMRNDEELPPIDYFSQSQQQILILSLFLTACTTQTWSAFAPILLDDPVTHFDDLNAYSFLDLIAGFLETGMQSRQFIISTCDERLFQLARQRFQDFGDRKRFYRFISVGRDGPVIECM